MKDLDFDELDRAVNSLIGGTQNQTDNADPTRSSVSEPALSNADATDSVPVASTPTLQPLAARRSSGRFMDVVHPSSDMRSSFVPPRPGSREGVMIQPSTDTAVEPPVLSTPTPAVEPHVEAPVATTPPEWPDPIDFNDKSSTALAADEPVVASTLASTDNIAPLESPFLADAKVEKRPLGAFADTTAEPIVAETAASEDVPDNGTPMPAELQTDLLSIESNEDTAEVTTSAAPPETFQSMPVSLGATPTPITSGQPTTAPVNETVAITQQYVEQPRTGDKPAGSIFDVDSYHKPIARPKKKKAGWLMIVWIVLLILLGAGAGAAFYFYVLPTL